ncbi:IclR family transcriptional regulator [Saccharomonospora glauca]|uniref:Transcriptional regulator n=1 Tax=Saccharomonospora glauca K62 TaxID=928724 RepID=I1D2W1_9PSEU|nr:helix-turn-helix domain-containing protein [Saccharomonospora glauca]EIE99285.1 transcriptional regulator [Saccharomonospora glauca K62]
MAPVTADPRRRSVLGRAFDILECFTGDEPEQTIGSLCARTELPPGTVHRMLANLAEWGAVERAARGRYRLGRWLWRLGWDVPDARRLKDVARPHLVDLHAASGEATLLASRDRDQLVVADVIAGNANVRREQLPRRLGVTDSAPGWVFLAYLPSEEAADLVRAAGGTVDFELWRKLAEIRRTGVAVRRGSGPGTLSWLAAPLFDDTRSIRSTICLVVPTERLNVLGHGRAVLAAAQAVTKGLASPMPSAG